MEKKFKLPKEFALKWIEALRSGEYKQGVGQLAIIKEEEEATLQNTAFCCLGVAGHLCGSTIVDLSNSFYLREVEEINPEIPSQILGGTENNLVRILSTFNDGVGDSAYKKGFILRNGYKNKFTFLEIADFIEDNVEFY